MRIAVVLEAVVLVVVAASLWSGCEQGGGSGSSGSEPAAIEAHSFALDAGKDGTIELSKYKGKPIILNFWATWCPPCLDEMPSFLKFAAWASRTAGVQTIAVSVDENWSVIGSFFKEKKLWSQGALPITILLDPKSSVALSFGTTRYPETYFIDKNFKIVRKFVGPQDWGSQEIMTWVAEHSK